MPKQAPTIPGSGLVDQTSGEMLPCATCDEAAATMARQEIEIAGLEHTIKSLSYKLEEAKRDKDAEAREHDQWDTVLDLFAFWCAAAADAEGKAKPKKAKLTGERFWLTVPLLKKHGVEMCVRAIVGRCYDHYSSKRANGSTIHYLEWERIFGNKGQGATAASNFEESANRAPRDWRDRALGLMPDIEDRLSLTLTVE